MNPEYGNRFSGYGRPAGYSMFPMGRPTPKRLAGLRANIRMPKKGPMTEYVRNLSRIELLAHEMGSRKGRGAR